MVDGQVNRMSPWRGMRIATVMVGPSLVLDGALATSVVAASTAAWMWGSRRGRPLWKLAAVGALIPWAYRLLLLPRLSRWGVNRREEMQSLPGDEVVTHRNASELNAGTTFLARPGDVWPWLAQLGAGNRGGFYSHDWLEWLAGVYVRSAERIIPELQHPQVGDIIVAEWNWRVLRVEPERALVIGNPSFSWSFVLQPLDGERTRLLLRVRVSPSQGGMLGSNLITLPHLLMQGKMMKGLRRRAEFTARQREAGALAPTARPPGTERPPAQGV